MNNPIISAFNTCLQEATQNANITAFRNENAGTNTVRVIYLLLSVRKYSFVNTSSNRTVSGITFVFTDGMPVNADTTNKGISIITFSITDANVYASYETMPEPPVGVICDIRIGKKSSLKAVYTFQQIKKAYENQNLSVSVNTTTSFHSAAPEAVYTPESSDPQQKTITNPTNVSMEHSSDTTNLNNNSTKQRSPSPSPNPVIPKSLPTDSTASDLTQPSSISPQQNHRRFDLWDTCTTDASTNPIFRHAFRVTKHPENQDIFTGPAKLMEILHYYDPSLFVFQLEIGDQTKLPHYQGYIKLKNKIRSKQLAKSLNQWAYGIQVFPAVDEKALIRYCTKSDTRVAGPWSFPPDLLGSRR